jgi:hypothetical protein
MDQMFLDAVKTHRRDAARRATPARHMRDSERELAPRVQPDEK